jgi:hypothetical protein
VAADRLSQTHILTQFRERYPEQKVRFSKDDEDIPSLSAL